MQVGELVPQGMRGALAQRLAGGPVGAGAAHPGGGNERIAWVLRRDGEADRSVGAHGGFLRWTGGDKNGNGPGQ